MTFDESDILEFQEIFKKVHGGELSREDALKHASEVLNLLQLLAQ